MLPHLNMCMKFVWDVKGYKFHAHAIKLSDYRSLSPKFGHNINVENLRNKKNKEFATHPIFFTLFFINTIRSIAFANSLLYWYMLKFKIYKTPYVSI